MERKIHYRTIVVCISLVLSQLCFGQVIEDAIIFKLHQQYKSNCSAHKINLKNFKNIQEFGTIRQKFPERAHLPNAKSSRIELSTIYHLKLYKGQSQKKILRYLNAMSEIEYAEADFQYQLTYSPNDPRKNEQDYLDALKVFDAWDIEKGDSSVIIAITDTGTDLDHPELINRLALNHKDSINGIDDDLDGYIDNFYGWNVASNNNNVSFENSGHGTNVAGIACSQVDNNFGISGIGFNVKFMTVRIDLASGQLSNAYESIVYAADHGADIINCSWGGYRASSYGRDVVRYATEKGALIIAGAGNNGISNKFYPAAYEEVIAVGQTEGIDTIRTQSNYGYWLDLFAPGDRVLTTNVIGGFGTNGGTSMASPMIAAGAALVKSQNPNFTAEQIAQRLFITADNIEGISPTNRADESGYGRANLYRALSEVSSPSIEFVQRKILSKNGSFNINDTVSISGSFKNYLAPSSAISVKLSTTSNDVRILNPNRTIPGINTLDSINIENDPFQIVINSNLPFNSEVVFIAEMTFNGIVKRQKFAFDLNNDYITINNSSFRHTMTSNGAIGFSGNASTLGDGVVFNDNTFLLFEGSFMIGNSSSYVADRFRNDNNGIDQDFSIVRPIDVLPSNKTDVELGTVFNDMNHANSQGLEITQHNYMLIDSLYRNAVIYVYHIRNVSNTPISQLNAGIILDWDVGDFRFNKNKFEPSRRLSLTYNQDSTIFCGIKMLNTNIGMNHYAIANVSGGDSTINLGDGFSDAEKYTVLNTSKSLTINPQQGVDMIDAVSTQTFDLAADSSFTVSYLITVDTSIQNLKIKNDSLQNIFNRLSLDIIEFERSNNTLANKVTLFPNPIFEDDLNIEIEVLESDNLSLYVYDINGRLIYESAKKKFNRGNHRLSVPTNTLNGGVYFLKIIGANLNIDDTFVISGR